ncbi:hypothetical protein HNQ64_002502 [Prosthecobacter dejongeii]|uniref:Uncharacterized protein n=1 Tax=Prosthecobacter dejongeii TaxID=48465 RepID=A0A7W7YLF4_9BACT|nr:hypothetical protein [Prosthecobacter dejongeii]
MRVQVSHHHSCAYGYFSDATGETCLISETTANWPAIVIGYEHHKMMLRVGHVRELLPLLQRFTMTGKLIEPVWEDYLI